ncbi:WD40 repeat-containing protein [Singulisphaera acidiphila DSM 18658]|uniref:WD40 repeat-containing protein n=2 Tax=Singulisphaera acidiphila TaxID=466153 RepID=L0DSU5_SINAD|nr:WD40 repeat-containing protein [Singulisphaera acidiphila DSM 18658]
MNPRTDAPAGSVRGRGTCGGSSLGRFLPRGFLSPELCILMAILAILVVGVSLSSQAGSEEESNRDELGVHESPVEGVAYAPDGRTVASASRDGAVMIWDLASRRSRRVVTRTVAGFSSVAFSPDGSRLVVGGLADGVKVLDPVTGETLATLAKSFGAVRDVTFSPDGASVAVGGDNGLIQIWNLDSGQLTRTLRGHVGLVANLAFAPDGRSLASAGIEDGAILWDLDTGRIRQRLQVDSGALSSLAFTRDGRTLAMGGMGCITVYELATGRSRTWTSPQGRVTSVRFLPDGLGLASSGLEGSIAFWSISPTEILPRFTLRGHKGGVKAMAMSPDGMTLISGGNDDTVKMWALPLAPDRLEALSSGDPVKIKTG